jgi:F0F1-type ATP synthase membrane subunit b/b'
MMKWLVNWGVKKYVVGIVNDVLDAKRESVAKARAVVSRYLVKADALLSFLKSLDEKLADNRVTDEEADDIVDDAVSLAEVLTVSI